MTTFKFVNNKNSYLSISFKYIITGIASLWPALITDFLFLFFYYNEIHYTYMCTGIWKVIFVVYEKCNAWPGFKPGTSGQKTEMKAFTQIFSRFKLIMLLLNVIVTWRATIKLFMERMLNYDRFTFSKL